ncbi:dicarboxylate/amino acid:cation symporter [Pseudoblastomonas halimionae]|uniref:C4-dicarboxylate transport protein n=1 Tax=Alteriqipengyuania halimionae TaxID=1926630 RepID=A0A6I4U1P2_9SPHN|nr:dicarboxylate/amino acid:cation symporter [Alteriqipengyuania halimionae]MXP08833.1 C4-dicarboxylate transporter DctA [Alteriqipengyuania halimionae]
MTIVPTPEAAGGMPESRQPIYRKLYFQVVVAIVLGAVLGTVAPEFGAQLKPLGDAFINLVKMIISPVIFVTVATGIAGMKDMGAVGSVAGKAFAYFLFFSTLALIIGLIVANVVQPGAGLNIDPATLDTSAVENYAVTAEEQTLTGFLLGMIPKTFFSAVTSGSILQVLLVAILSGVAIAATRPQSDLVFDVLSSFSEVVFKLVHMLMKLAPIGAFGAIAFTIGEFGLGSLASLAALVGTFYLTSLLFVIVVLGIVGWLTGFSIFALIKYLREELLLVLGTSSSEAALPSLMEKMEIAGCRKSVVGLVVPTGYSFNLDGTNIYMTLAALFIAQAVGIDLSLSEQIALVTVAMISSKGAAGVTGAGFVILAATLSVVPSVPVAGMALILGIDRFMSECRALTNFVGNSVATIVVAKWEGALDRERLAAALAGTPMPLPEEDIERHERSGPQSERLIAASETGGAA